MQEDEERTWENLPPHILLRIYKNLNVSDIITLSLSNKWYQEYATHNDVWEARCLKLRSDILFLSIAGNEHEPLPDWLLNLEEKKKTLDFFRRPPRNFYFISFMQIWCKYPHAWKRGNTIVDVKCVVLKQIKDFGFGFPSTGYEPELYENWKTYFSIRLVDTIWLHNNQNGSYVIKRFTLNEPFYFQLPFSKLLYGVDPKDNSIKSIRKPDKSIREPFVRARFKLYNRKLEHVSRVAKNTAVLFGAATALYLSAYVGAAIFDELTSFRLPYYVMNFKETCEIVQPGVDQMLNPTFQGSLIHQIDTHVFSKLANSAVITGSLSTLSAMVRPAITELQTMCGVNSLFSYDGVEFKNIVPLNDLCVFITSEGDVTRYSCASYQSDDGNAKTYAVNWIHNMDEGKYDPLGSLMCANCGQKQGKLAIQGLETLGSFCEKRCVKKYWKK